MASAHFLAEANEPPGEGEKRQHTNDVDEVHERRPPARDRTKRLRSLVVKCKGQAIKNASRSGCAPARGPNRLHRAARAWGCRGSLGLGRRRAHAAGADAGARAARRAARLRRADRPRGGLRCDPRGDARAFGDDTAACRHRRDRRLRSQPDAGRPGQLGARAALGRALRARARAAGEGQRRGPLRHALERTRGAHARLRGCAARLLRRLPGRGAALVPQRHGLAHAPPAVLQAGSAVARALPHQESGSPRSGRA